VAAAAVSPAAVKVAADWVAAAVRVVADHPVDSVVAVEAVETADASLSYRKKRGERSDRPPLLLLRPAGRSY